MVFPHFTAPKDEAATNCLYFGMKNAPAEIETGNISLGPVVANATNSALQHGIVPARLPKTAAISVDISKNPPDNVARID